MNISKGKLTGVRSPFGAATNVDPKNGPISLVAAKSSPDVNAFGNVSVPTRLIATV